MQRFKKKKPNAETDKKKQNKKKQKKKQKKKKKTANYKERRTAKEESIPFMLCGHCYLISLIRSYFNIIKTCLFKYTKTLPPKNENFQIKNSKLVFTFLILKYINCGYSLEPPERGGSNECPQSMFLNKNTKTNYIPLRVNPSFTI